MQMRGWTRAQSKGAYNMCDHFFQACTNSHGRESSKSLNWPLTCKYRPPVFEIRDAAFFPARGVGGMWGGGGTRRGHYQ